jgi:diguanylate cyclase (GGDEF)-like protein/PAS domain S-box-containing protein
MARLRRIPFSLSSLKIPVIGLAASLSLALVIAYWETQAASREFDAVADNHRQVLDAGFHKYEDKIVALRALFDATNHPISRREFEVFANELVADAGAIEAFSWIPRVERDDRAAFELGAAKDGFVGYRITALNPHGKPVTSGERDEYFPVLYSAEVSREAPIYGLDLGSDPMRRQTLQRARDTDSFSATPIVTLKTGAAGRHGFLIVLPVFKHGLPHETIEDRRRNLAGFVLGVFQLSPLIDSILHRAAAPDRLDIYVFQSGANGNALPLHIHSSRLRTTPAEPRSLAALKAGMHWSGELTIANVHLAIVAIPFSAQKIFTRYSDAFAIFAMGLLLTGISQFYFTKRKRAERALAESEERLNAIFAAAADGIALVEVETKKFRVVNASFCRMLGYSEKEMLNLSVPDIHPKEDVPQVVREFEQRTKPVVEFPVKRKDGSVFFAQLNTSPVTLGGTPCLMGIFRDITERRASEDALNQAQEDSLALITVLQRHERELALITKLNDVLQACNSRDEAFPIVAAAANDLLPGTNGALALVASRMLEAETVAQWGPDQAMLPYFSLDECWALRTGQMREVDGADKGAVCRHFKSTPNGPYICLPLTIHGETTGLLYLNVGASGVIDEDLRRLLSLFGNVIKLSLSNLKLRDTLLERAIRDPLTGLFNRRYLDETLMRELHHAGRGKTPLCVAMLDIDNFKIFNDENGHEAGDEVLKAVGEILKNSTRVSDIACRFGGEEFVLILNDVDSPTALRHVEQICREIKRKQIICNGKSLYAVTVSAGLAEAPAHGASPEELLRAADKALYEAKSAGRDRVVVFSSQMLQIAALPAA